MRANSTRRAVTQFIVEQVNPKLGEIILDPACGTGGFLVCAIEHLRKQAKTEEDERSIQECFQGIEKKHLPHVLCMTNLLLHGIDVPSNVRHDNTLARPLRDWSMKERVDVIVTNPPFGGMEEDGVEANFPTEFRTRETADLFLVLIMRLLNRDGRAGMVLPDGTLFGEGVKTRIKEELLRECNLHTIVRLPNEVFNPHTGIHTNLLFFTKGEPASEVWYYEHPYPDGAKSYNKSNPIRRKKQESGNIRCFAPRYERAEPRIALELRKVHLHTGNDCLLHKEAKLFGRHRMHLAYSVVARYAAEFGLPARFMSHNRLLNSEKHGFGRSLRQTARAARSRNCSLEPRRRKTYHPAV